LLMTSGPIRLFGAVNVAQLLRGAGSATGTSERSSEFDQTGLSGQDFRFSTGLQPHG